MISKPVNGEALSKKVMEVVGQDLYIFALEGMGRMDINPRTSVAMMGAAICALVADGKLILVKKDDVEVEQKGDSNEDNTGAGK